MTYEEWARRHPQAAAELAQINKPEITNEGQGSEARVQSQIRLESVRYGSLWRNNAGAYTDDTGRLIRYGLGNDSKKFWENWRSGDLVGITRVQVQPHHVGRVFGVFTMIEVKEESWKKPKDQRERAQLNCLNHVTTLGGIAGFANSVPAYQSYVENFIS